jgi:hypothetical protein
LVARPDPGPRGPGRRSVPAARSQRQHACRPAGAIYLLVTGLIYTAARPHRAAAGKSSLLLIRGIIGLVFGGVLLLMAIFDIGSLSRGLHHPGHRPDRLRRHGLFQSVFKREGKPLPGAP